MKRYTVAYNDQLIEFELHRKKVKHINLHVRPDLSVMVSANQRVPLAYIQNFVRAKAPWILRAQSQFQNAPKERAVTKEYVSGDTFKYLGKQLRLKVAEGPREGAKYGRGSLYLQIKNQGDYLRKQKLVELWFRARAEIVFRESLERIYPLVEAYGIKRPEYIIKSMKSRWGSCDRHKRLITLNLELIKFPKDCIDYLVLHELLHFKHGNHGRHFYDLLKVLMPDWKQRNQILQEETERGL